MGRPRSCDSNGLKRGPWTPEEDKKLIDPLTHRPKAAAVGSADGDPKNASNLCHMAQWERARLEAEARLVKESKARQNEPAAAGSSGPVSASAKILNKMASTRTRPPCLDILKAWRNVCFKSYESSNNDIDGIINFGDGKDLESPTSTLHLSEKKQAVTTIASFENLNKNLGMGSEINEGLFNKCSRDMAFDAGEAWIMGRLGTAESFIEGFFNIL